MKKDIQVICKGKDHYIYREIDILHTRIIKAEPENILLDSNYLIIKSSRLGDSLNITINVSIYSCI
jgi:hypothetical protein